MSLFLVDLHFLISVQDHSRSITGTQLRQMLEQAAQGGVGVPTPGGV